MIIFFRINTIFVFGRNLYRGTLLQKKKNKLKMTLWEIFLQQLHLNCKRNHFTTFLHLRI